jgi:hypothetical protein
MPPVPTSPVPPGNDETGTEVPATSRARSARSATPAPCSAFSRASLPTLGILCAFACGGAGGRGAQSDAHATTDSTDFDCERYATASEFEGVNAETRTHLRSMCELESEFQRFVADRRSCKTAADCTTVQASCPFDCAVAVASSERESVTAKYEQLSERFRTEGSSCEYECGDAKGADCIEGVCALESK